MEQLRRYAIFVAVVEAGSMTGAAKSLGMTPSAVSRHISQLESLIGLLLLYCSSLTEVGEVVLQGYRALQQTLSETELRLSEVRDSLLGEVRIAAPVGMAGQPLALALSPLLQAHSDLIQIIADDEKRDLITERIYVALRVGILPDLTLEQ